MTALALTSAAASDAAANEVSRPGARAPNLGDVRRLWVRWALLVVFVVVLAVVFVNLGEWQLRPALGA